MRERLHRLWADEHASASLGLVQCTAFAVLIVAVVGRIGFGW